jgi:hypothetical protein
MLRELIDSENHQKLVYFVIFFGQIPLRMINYMRRFIIEVMIQGDAVGFLGKRLYNRSWTATNLFV